MKTLRILAALALLFTLCAPQARAESLAVGAGAGYKRLLAEVNAAFSRQTGIDVVESYGHMGHMAAQARESGRMDILFGDLDFLKGIKDLAFEDFLDVGRGRLVVAYASGVTLAAPRDIAAPDIDRIGLPDTKNAIYGKAGMEFLTRSGLLESVRPRLVEVSTVPQVSAYLVTGEVKAGLVNLTDALGVRDRIGGFVEVDQSLYEPIRIVGGLLPGAKAKPAVAAYLRFLGTPEAKALLAKHGL
ncbi:Putative binding protein [Fundidesulfovibrio magnetotacticus]|uniref:Binding protein n=1 Tax=Fundidesulfovibrio magnetotacticus TaxID=2730080 RepID=A0A6V8LUR9_9BACT|nr:molybdate ABC transporter substrate-binding protein [Fundidesulfovibrio magnetotacticus]GFK94700.1 Putative binding protein [Fundidesulfovibrio magnetotacticus]